MFLHSRYEELLSNYTWRESVFFVEKGCETRNFNIVLQEKLGVDLEVSYQLEPDDSECVVCGDSFYANDFDVLDTCNHLICTNCAVITVI